MTRPIPTLLLISLTASLAPLPTLAQGSPTVDKAKDQSANVDRISTDLSTINQDAYILGPGDQIALNMFGQPDLFPTPYNVLVDGTVSLPFVGRVPVKGRSIRQAQDDITKLYTRFYKRPYLSIVLTQARTMTLGIAGEVRRPGTYPIPGNEGIPTVTQLIKLAGGSTQSADLKKVQIRRPQISGPDQMITVDLFKLLVEGDLSQNVKLRDEDTVVIPGATELDLASSALLADASFASDRSEPLNIAVVGQVYRPGPHTITPGSKVLGEAGNEAGGGIGSLDLPTVTQAIQTAGGIKPDADVRQVQIRRRSRTGEEHLIDVDLWKLLQEGDLKQDLALQQGDTVIVPTAKTITAAEQTALAIASFSPATINVNVIGEVIRPGVVKVQPNTPLSTAISTAGGFRPGRAKKGSVKLIRLNPDGTVTERKVKVDQAAAINEESNPAMRNNDVVVIGRNGLSAFSDTFRSILSPINGARGFLNPFF